LLRCDEDADAAAPSIADKDGRLGNTGGSWKDRETDGEEIEEAEEAEVVTIE
jgi:hypothetical protein